jgi:hypothetical protein
MAAAEIAIAFGSLPACPDVRRDTEETDLPGGSCEEWTERVFAADVLGNELVEDCDGYEFVRGEIAGLAVDVLGLVGRCCQCEVVPLLGVLDGPESALSVVRRGGDLLQAFDSWVAGAAVCGADPGLFGCDSGLGVDVALVREAAGEGCREAIEGMGAEEREGEDAQDLVRTDEVVGECFELLGKLVAAWVQAGRLVCGSEGVAGCAVPPTVSAGNSRKRNRPPSPGDGASSAAEGQRSVVGPAPRR